MDELKERWTSNEKVIRQIMKALIVGKDDEKIDQSKASKTQITPKLKKKKPKDKKIKTKSSPAVVADGNLIFSKFDLVQSDKHQIEKKKIKKDDKLKKSLKKLKKEEGEISKLVEAGETEKVDKIRNENAWKNALEKAEGKKVFDDPKRLERSLKKHKKIKQKHAKEWAGRKKDVEMKMKKKQEKRERNINKKIEQKQKKKLGKKKNKK